MKRKLDNPISKNKEQYFLLFFFASAQLAGATITSDAQTASVQLGEAHPTCHNNK